MTPQVVACLANGQPAGLANAGHFLCVLRGARDADHVVFRLSQHLAHPSLAE